ncbi:MAG: PQQ-dependent sugar dehydrogenase [Bacteroidia bacterium]
MKNKTIYTAICTIFISLLFLNTNCKKKKNTTEDPVPIDTTYTLTVTDFVKNLVTPWEIAFAPDGRIFFTERAGRVRVVNNGVVETWLDLTNVVEQSESGLLGIALDPNFKTNGYVYIAYTYSTPMSKFTNKLVRCIENSATKKGSENKVLIDSVIGSNNHNGGPVKFGPDGKLYWTVGDRFDQTLPQNLNSLNGKVLRLNADGTKPTDNPFPNSYIWSYGNRNVQGLAWQPGTNLLFATEHGPSGEKGVANDEVNIIEKGKNYGWPDIIGSQTKAGMETPIACSGTTITWAPAGCTFVSQGKWKGSFLFTGLKGQTLYRAIIDPKDNRKILRIEEFFATKYGRLRDVAEGPDGSIYLCVSNRDGRGTPKAEDDRILKIKIE